MKDKLPIFPVVMTIAAFVSFMVVYTILIVFTVNPLYVKGLIFALMVEAFFARFS